MSVRAGWISAQEQSRRGSGEVPQTQGTSPHTFFTVKYGDNKETLLNARCRCYSLIAHIRQTCRCNDEVVLDLVDLDGNPKQLSTHLKEYADLYLDSRRTYILIRVDNITEDGKERHKYTSLLDDVERHYPDIPEKLDILSRPASDKPSLLRRDSKWNTVRTITRIGRQGNHSSSGKRAK